jgi:hypothetical protein
MDVVSEPSPTPLVSTETSSKYKSGGLFLSVIGWTRLSRGDAASCQFTAPRA